MTGVDVVIHGGFLHEGIRHRDARVRPADAEDCRVVLDCATDVLPASLATTILTRCTISLGPVDDVREKHVRALSVGDRDALLLHIHRATYGNELRCLFECGACDAELEVTLDADALLARGFEPSPALDEADGGMRMRAATGADHEWASERAGSGSGSPDRALLARCVDGDIDGAMVELVPELDAWLSSLDPQADIRLESQCPHCGSDCAAVLDPISYLVARMCDDARTLELDVHVLASAYGWSERDILKLPPGRRARYLDLVEAAR